MYHVSIKESLHEWDKKNLVTQSSKKGGYDSVVCANCGIKGRRYNFSQVAIPETYSRDKAYMCPKARLKAAPTRVRVTRCTAVGSVFENLTPNSEHEVVTPPEGYNNDHKGVWVMGVGEPVKLLSCEYTVVS